MQTLTYSSKADPSYASLEWSAIQTLLEKANLDVLLLLDCCAAASAAPTVGSAVTETIAACGFESIAPRPGRYSFTNSLIEVLDDWIDGPPFSAAMLHNKVLSVLKHEQPERARHGKKRKLECRRTPIHILAAADPRLPSIELGMRAVKSPVPSSESSSMVNVQASAWSSIVTPRSEDLSQPCSKTISSKRKAYEEDSVNTSIDGDFEVPRVIISLALERHQTLNSETCGKWLASCPALIRHARIEGVFKSFSALLLLSLPVVIWNMLPDDPACSFVGYVTSTNLYQGMDSIEGGLDVTVKADTPMQGYESDDSQSTVQGEDFTLNASLAQRFSKYQKNIDLNAEIKAKLAGQHGLSQTQLNVSFGYPMVHVLTDLTPGLA
jgi:hypothetical protein